MRLASRCAALALVVACGRTTSTEPGGQAPDGEDASHDSGPSVTVQGSVAGHTLVPEAAVAYEVETGDAANEDYVVLLISDEPMSCSTFWAFHEGSTRLDLFVYSPTAGAPITPGTYSGPESLDGGVGTQPYASGYLHVFGPDCVDTPVASQGGSITLTSLTPDVRGSFQLTFDGGTLSGEFDVPTCQAINTVDAGACL
jgi:hypothetical protein